MSGRINKDKMELIIQGMEKFKGLAECLANGEPVTLYCRENGINIKYVQKAIMAMTQVFSPEEAYNNIRLLNTDYLLTGTEIIYNYVFNCNPDTTEVLRYMPMDAEETLMAILKNPEEAKGLPKLLEREASVLYKRCYEGKTLEEVGNEIGVTRERVRQLEARCLRKLRTPLHKQMLMMGKNYLKHIEDEYEIQRKEIMDELVAKKIEKDEEIQKLEKQLGTCEYHEDVYIEDLELSVRSYNCLRRAGYERLDQLLDLTLDDYLKIKNLGIKSTQEIIMKVREYYPKYLKVGE